jgi:hypothetical protein
MIECPLCSSSNAVGAQICEICDTELVAETTLQRIQKPELVVESGSKEIERSHFIVEPEVQNTQDSEVIIDTLDITSSRFNKKKLVLVIMLTLLFIIPLFLVFDSFIVPHAVHISRSDFEELKEKYLFNKEGWDFQKGQVLSSMQNHRFDDEIGKEALQFDSIPLEVVMAFLMEELELSKEQFHGFSVYPNGNGASPTVILSKYESKFWPLPILISLKVRLVSEEGLFKPQFMGLYRGSKELSTDLAWVYFGEEFEMLRRLESFSGGVSNLKLAKRFEENEVKDDLASSLELSWDYLHRAIF